MQRIDINGRRFGRLVVLFRAENIRGRYTVRVRCDCGVEKDVIATALRSGGTSSCGCLRRDIHGVAKTRHGMSSSREFKSWTSMLDRCRNPRCSIYKNYGGRGIGFVEQWKDFTVFFADMGPRPLGTSLDRINNELGYSPDNCRWSTRSEQNRNRRDTILSPAIAQEIRDRHAAGESQASIARRLGLKEPRVNSVVHGRSWVV